MPFMNPETLPVHCWTDGELATLALELVEEVRAADLPEEVGFAALDVHDQLLLSSVHRELRRRRRIDEAAVAAACKGRDVGPGHLFGGAS